MRAPIRFSLLALLPLALGCAGGSPPEPAAATPAQSVPGVATAEAEEAQVRDEFLAPGAVAIDVDLAEVRDARAAFEEAEARAHLAADQVRRIEPLVREAIAPRKELEAAIAEREAAAAAVERARVALAVFGRGEGRAALRDDQSWAIAYVMQPDIGRCTAGAEVEFVADAFPKSPLSGSIEAAPTYVDPTTRLAPVALRLVDRDRRLRPGMSGRVIVRGAPRSAVVVPRAAVVVDGESAVVFIAQGNEKFVPRRVTVGAPAGDRVEIAHGLSAGTRVATTGAASLLSAERLPAAGAQED